MIYIIEAPHTMPSKCWAVYDKKDLLRVLREAHCSRYIFDPVPLSEYFTMSGVVDLDDARVNNEDGDFDWLIAEAEQNSMDTLYYTDQTSGDTVKYEGDLSDADAELHALLEYNGHDLSWQRVYFTDAEAVEDYHNESCWSRHHGASARNALLNELMSYDVDVDA